VQEGWRQGPAIDIESRWRPEAVGPAVRQLLSVATRPDPVYGA
jgi:hypothetical protein